MVGIVNHEHEGKKWESKYSNDLGNKIHQTVLIDGLFMVINKNRIKENFDTDVKGFHLYDVDFCFRNYIKDVKIGVLFNIRVTHKSIGQTNEQWELNRQEFSNKLVKSRVKTAIYPQVPWPQVPRPQLPRYRNRKIQKTTRFFNPKLIKSTNILCLGKKIKMKNNPNPT